MRVLIGELGQRLPTLLELAGGVRQTLPGVVHQPADAADQLGDHGQLRADVGEALGA